VSRDTGGFRECQASTFWPVGCPYALNRIFRAIKEEIDPAEAQRVLAEVDFQTRRALKLAPDDEELKKLRAEVVQLRKLPE
jgi:hypothetical protein